MKIDSLDLQIVDLLKENGRIQNNEIAKRLSVSEGTIRNRIKKLVDNQFLMIRGLINPGLMLNKQIFFLGVQISDAKQLESTAENLSKIACVTSVYMVTGRYDLLVEVFIESYNLLNFMSVDLGSIDSITATESFMTLKSYNKWI